MVGSLETLTKGLQLLAALGLVATLFAATFLLREIRGVLQPEAKRILRMGTYFAGAWLLVTVVNFVVELAVVLGTPISGAFDINSLRSFLTQTALGKSYIYTAGAALIALLTITRVRKIGGALGLFAITMIGIITPVFQSHASNFGNHGLAIGSLLFHVVGICLWVGGVFALLLISQEERAISLQRFSAVALWLAVIVVASGSANAWTRLHSFAAWQSFYGFLVALKIALTVVLLFIGYRHRKYILEKLAGSRAVFQLLVNEVMVMAIALSLGTWLSVSQPPSAGADLSTDPVLGLTGIAMQSRPSISRLLWSYIPDGTFLGLLLLATALYIRGVVVLSRRGDKWPIGRTVAFACGVAAADFATSGGIGVYAHLAFSFHMIGHMILGMIAPIGFVLSAPITLALRTLPSGRTAQERGLRQLLVAILHSRYSKIVTNPVAALAIFDGSLFALYMTPLFGHLMQSHSGHLFMDLHFLLAGTLFFYVIVGVDPNPRKIPHLVRIIVLFAAMSIHAFFSVALMSSTTLLDGGFFAALHRPWFTDLLADQRLGGAIGWAMGEIPILLALIATFIQWVRDDAREAKRLDRAADRADAMGIEDELTAYNRYLAGLGNESRDAKES